MSLAVLRLFIIRLGLAGRVHQALNSAEKRADGLDHAVAHLDDRYKSLDHAEQTHPSAEQASKPSCARSGTAAKTAKAAEQRTQHREESRNLGVGPAGTGTRAAR